MSISEFPQIDSSRGQQLPRSRQYVFHVGLRWLLVAVAIFGVCMYRIRERMLFEADARALYERGWKLEKTPNGNRLSGNFRLINGPRTWEISLSQVANVAAWEEVSSLSIHGNCQASLGELRELNNLKSVSVGGWKIRREDVEDLCRIPNLESLALEEIDASALQPLREARQLKHLQLSHAPSGSLRILPQIPQLRWLALHCDGLQFDDMVSQLAFVAQCRQLEVLNISPGFVPAEDMELLQHAPRLRMLRLETIEPGLPNFNRAVAGISSLRVVCPVGSSGFCGDEFAGFLPGASLQKLRPQLTILKPCRYLPGDPFAW